MNTHSHKSPVRLSIVLLLIVAFSTTACSLHGVRVDTISPIAVDIVIDEGGFYRFPGHDGLHLTDQCRYLLDHITRVEFHDGYIRYLGTKVQPGGVEVQGSLDLSMTAENGQLKATITAVDIPGIDLTDRCIVDANQKMEEAFTEMVFDTHGEVVFNEVTVEEGALRMKIQVNLD